MSSYLIRTLALGCLALCGSCDSPNDPTPRNAIVVVSGDDQSTLPGGYLPRPLVVRAVDANGEPIEGLQLTWSGSGESSFRTLRSHFVTDQDGIAMRLWWPGYSAEEASHTATVSADGLKAATFSAVSAPGALQVYPVPDTVRLAGLGDTASVWMRVVSSRDGLDTLIIPHSRGINWGPDFPRVAEWTTGPHGLNLLRAVEYGTNSTYHFSWGRSGPGPGVYFTVIVTPQ